MRVLMIGRSTLYASPGGDTVQIISTAKYLQKLGVEVEIRLSGEKISFKGIDLIHFFNIIRPDDILPHIFKSKLPFVVSTIFVDYSEYEKTTRTGVLKYMAALLSSDRIEYCKALARFVINGNKINSLYYLLKGHRASIRYIASKASILLPNSDNEYHRLAQKYGINNKYLKIPNAIDEETFNYNTKPNEAFKDHVLCIGRIEGRKNQLNLIKALADTDLKLTIIGKPSPNHLSYYNECKKLADERSNIQILEHVDHSMLASIYKAAKVHVLASWFETTGLSSLEAGMMDCNVVISAKGDTEEYFKNCAYYCNPQDIQSIRQAVVQAYENPINPELRKIIVENYTWQKAACETLKAYNSIFG